MYNGRNGYLESTKQIIGVTRYIERGLRQIEGIYVMGDPQVSVVAIGRLYVHVQSCLRV